MNVIGHQTPRMQLNIERRLQLAEVIQVAFEVLRCGEYHLSIVATLHDMMRHAGYDDPTHSGHH